MRLLRRTFRFFLGVQAVGILGSLFVHLYTMYSMRAHAGEEDYPKSVYVTMLTIALILPLLGSLPTMAWWAIRKGIP